MKNISADIFKKYGLKNTKSRKELFETISNAKQPITAEEIFLRSKNDNPSLSLSTVYRNLEMLVDKGIVDKSIYNDNKARYEVKGNIHKHYLVCMGCGKTVDVENCPVELMENELIKSTQFEITGHRIEIYGYCSLCKGKR